jgi:hypothetical protein
MGRQVVRRRKGLANDTSGYEGVRNELLDEEDAAGMDRGS